MMFAQSCVGVLYDVRTKVCGRTLYDVRTTTKSRNDAVLRTYLRR